MRRDAGDGEVPDEFAFSFSAVSQPFSFWVVADDSRSQSVRVDVQPLPQMKGSSFHVTPPDYMGLKPYDQPGPPQTLEVPAGSTRQDVGAAFAGCAEGGWARRGRTTADMTKGDGGWGITHLVNESSSYQIAGDAAGAGEAARAGGRGRSRRCRTIRRRWIS